MWSDLADDHGRARELGAGAGRTSRASRSDAEGVETNIVIFDVRASELTGDEFNRRTLEGSGVRFSVLGPTLVRAVLHLDVPADGVERALAAARAALRQ